MGLPRVSRRRLRTIIEEQLLVIVEQRRTIQAQATAIDELVTRTSELSESCATWRVLALNTADAVTDRLTGGDR